MFYSEELRQVPKDNDYVSIVSMLPKSPNHRVPDVTPDKIYFSLDSTGSIRLSAGLLKDYNTCDIQFSKDKKSFRIKVGYDLPIKVRNSSIGCAEFCKQFNFRSNPSMLCARSLRILVELNKDGWYYSKDVPDHLFDSL